MRRRLPLKGVTMMTKMVMGALLAGVMGAGPALADDVPGTIVRELRTQGFDTVSTERTWLGRTRILASGERGEREIIVNPNTGEILRDLWLVRRGDDGAGLLVDGSSGDDDDRRRDDDDRDDDNGGRSGGNSGSGGSGGSGGGDDNGGDSD